MALQVLEVVSSAYELVSRREPLEQRKLLEALCLNSVLTDEASTSPGGDPSTSFRFSRAGPDDGGPPDDSGGPHPEWSGWTYAYRTFWGDPGSWDEQKVAEFLELAATGGA